MKCELWKLEQRSWDRQIDQPMAWWVLRGSIGVAIWVYVKATRWVSCGGGMGSEMGLPSHVVAKWAAARWVSPSRTLVLSRLSVSLCSAYSLFYRSLSPLSFCLTSQFFFSFFFFIHFSIWTTGFTFFWICIFFLRFIWTRSMIHDFGGGPFFFLGPERPGPPLGSVPSFECHKTICLSIYPLSVVMNSWGKNDQGINFFFFFFGGYKIEFYFTLSVYVCEVSSPTPHKHLYLWSDHRIKSVRWYQDIN